MGRRYTQIRRIFADMFFDKPAWACGIFVEILFTPTFKNIHGGDLIFVASRLPSAKRKGDSYANVTD